MKVRITSKGWEHFTGSMGFRAMFEDGVSVGDLDARQVARIGSSLTIVDEATGLQVGPSVFHHNIQDQNFKVADHIVNAAEEAVVVADEREQLIASEAARAAKDAEALKEAQAKAQAAVDDVVIYSRAELEAIGANDGIAGMRLIAEPLGLKGRGIAELVGEILKAQAALTVA